MLQKLVVPPPSLVHALIKVSLIIHHNAIATPLNSFHHILSKKKKNRQQPLKSLLFAFVDTKIW